MRTFLKLFFLTAIAAAGACGGKSKAAEEPTPSGDNSKAPVCGPGGTPVGSPATVVCGATYDGCCYSAAATACAAAGCAENCIQAESMPVQVSCPAEVVQPEQPAAPDQPKE